MAMLSLQQLQGTNIRYHDAFSSDKSLDHHAKSKISYKLCIKSGAVRKDGILGVATRRYFLLISGSKLNYTAATQFCYKLHTPD